MTQAASSGQPRPENRSELLYWKLRKKVWLIASGLTLFGALAVAPFVERPLRLLLLAPLVYVFLPSGAIVETHSVPDDEPVGCALGGGDLYVTTAGGELHRARNIG